jgi:hypothetical protein
MGYGGAIERETVTLDSLQNWETGRNSPSPLAAAALADFLNRHQKVTPPASPKIEPRNLYISSGC